MFLVGVQPFATTLFGVIIPLPIPQVSKTLIYKHVHKCNPVKVVLPGISNPPRYSEGDLWMISTAVRRVHERVGSPAPPLNLVTYDDWIHLCAEDQA